jgi:hypothetical protein
MHQNKFHTERIQQLTRKAEASAGGGSPLTEEEQSIADHLKILYKYANKGIKGRGKKEHERTTAETRSRESKKAERAIEERPLAPRPFPGQTLLPPPLGEGGLEMSLLGPSYSSRHERVDDVFVGVSGNGQARSGLFEISGDGREGGWAGMPLGLMGSRDITHA